MDEKCSSPISEKQLQEMMSDLVAFVRSNERLQLAKKKQREIYEAVTELYNYSVISPELIRIKKSGECFLPYY